MDTISLIQSPEAERDLFTEKDEWIKGKIMLLILKIFDWIGFWNCINFKLQNLYAVLFLLLIPSTTIL